MATTIKTFREAVQAELSTDLDITFHAGAPIFTGPVQEADTGFCWSTGATEVEDVVLQEHITVHARVYRRFREPQGYDDLDPNDLEDLAVAMQTALKDHQAGEYGVWMFRVTEVEIDHETQAVEATIVGVTMNEFAP